MKLKLSKFYLFSLLFACLSLCAGCGVGREQAAGAVKAEPKKSLVIYNCNAEDWTAPVIKEFQEETGIAVTVVAGGTGELAARVKKEKAQPGGDVLWGGAGSMYVSLRDYLEPYDSKEQASLMDAFRVQGNAYYNYVADPYVISYNTNRVGTTEAPSGWQDLLNLRWQGQIALADPAKSGATYGALWSIWENTGKNARVIDRLIRNLDHKIISNPAAQIKALSDGGYDLTVTREALVLKYLQSGAPVRVVYPREGTCISTEGIGVLKGCRQPENARRFVDFILSRKVQGILPGYYRRSVRQDVAAGADMLPLAKFAYRTLDFEQAQADKEKLLQQWRENMAD